MNDATPTTAHSISIRSGGEGIEAWLQNVCSCGWESEKFYEHDDYQRTHRAESEARHRRLYK